MYNSNTESLGLILGVELFFSLGHCSGALCNTLLKNILKLLFVVVDNRQKSGIETAVVHTICLEAVNFIAHIILLLQML